MSLPRDPHGTPGGGFRKSGSAGRRFGGRSTTPTKAGGRGAPAPGSAAKLARGRSASPRAAPRSAVVLNNKSEAGALSQDARYTIRGGTPSPLMSASPAGPPAAPPAPALPADAQHLLDQAALGGFLPASSMPPALDAAGGSVGFSSAAAAVAAAATQASTTPTPAGALAPPPAGGDAAAGPKPEEFSSSLHNISQLRRQIDELQSTHKQEEMMLLNRMKFMLQKSQEAQHSSKLKEVQLAGELGTVEGRLRKEMEEKEQAMTLYQQFKDQGGAIISRLSTTLADLQQRYQEDGKRCVYLQKEVINLQQELRTEHAKRAELEHQLAQARLQSHERPASGSTNVVPDASPTTGVDAATLREALQRERQAREEAERLVETLTSQDTGSQVYRLQQLVKEKDARIIVLEQQGRSAAATPTFDGNNSAQGGNAFAARVGAGAGGGTSPPRGPDPTEQWRTKLATMEKFYEGKLQEFKDVLHQQEETLAATKEQNKQLREQQQQRGASSSGANTLPPADSDASREMVERLMDDAGVEGEVMQNALIRTLVDELKREKRERLKMEEQSDRMIFETNKQVSTLEQRIKQAQLTAATPRRTPRQRGGSGGAPLGGLAGNGARGFHSSDSSLRSNSSSPVQCAAAPPVHFPVAAAVPGAGPPAPAPAPATTVGVGVGAGAMLPGGTAAAATGNSHSHSGLEATLSRWKSLRSDARAALEDNAAVSGAVSALGITVDSPHGAPPPPRHAAAGYGGRSTTSSVDTAAGEPAARPPQPAAGAAAIASPIDVLPATAATPLSFASDRTFEDVTKSPPFDSSALDHSYSAGAAPDRPVDAPPSSVSSVVRHAMSLAGRQPPPPPQHQRTLPNAHPTPPDDIRSSTTPPPATVPADDVEAAGTSLLKRLRRHLEEPKGPTVSPPVSRGGTNYGAGLGAGAGAASATTASVLRQTSPPPPSQVAPTAGGRPAPSAAAAAGRAGSAGRATSPVSPATKACSDSIFELERQLEELLADFK